HVAEQLQDAYAPLVVEGSLGRGPLAAVAVVDVLGVGHRQKLLKVPAVDVVAKAVLAVTGHAAGVLPELGVSARRPLRIQPGFPEHVLVVVQDGVGRVERNRVQLPVDGVVVEQVRNQVVHDARLPVDELLQGHRGLEVDHTPRADLIHVHQVRRIARLQRQNVLVQQVVVAALVDGFHLDDVLRGVELVDERGQDVPADGAAQRVPKLDLDLGCGRARQGQRQHQHQERPRKKPSVLHAKSSLSCCLTAYGNVLPLAASQTAATFCLWLPHRWQQRSAETRVAAAGGAGFKAYAVIGGHHLLQTNFGRPYPFSAPPTMPRMSCFWNSKKTTMAGKVTTVTPAMMEYHA